MQMSLKRRAVSAANAAVLLAVFSVGTQAKLSQNKVETSFGTTTKSEILDRSERLCMKIMPITRPAHLKTEKLTGYGQNGAPQHYWSVDCYNGQSDLLHFYWNADSGEIASVSRQT